MIEKGGRKEEKGGRRVEGRLGERAKGRKEREE